MRGNDSGSAVKAASTTDTKSKRNFAKVESACSKTPCIDACEATTTPRSRERSLARDENDHIAWLRLWLMFVLAVMPMILLFAVFAYASLVRDESTMRQAVACVPYAFGSSVAWSGGTALTKFFRK